MPLKVVFLSSRFGYILSFVLLLLALSGLSIVKYGKQISKDNTTIVNHFASDERLVVSAINALSEGNSDLDEVQTHLNRIPDYIVFKYHDSLHPKLWNGNLSDADLLRTKALPNGNTLSIGWKNIEELTKSTFKTNGHYTLSQYRGDVVLQGDNDLNLSYQGSNKRKWLASILSLCFFLSFICLLQTLKRLERYQFYVTVPLVYLLYSLLNIKLFSTLNIWHDITLQLMPWADSLMGLLMLTLTFFAFFLRKSEDTPLDKYDIWVEAIATTFIFVALILSMHNFINSPISKIDFNELSSISWVEAIGISCLVSWSIILFALTQKLIAASKVITNTNVKYVVFIAITLIIFALSAVYLEVNRVWVLPLFVLVYLILNDLYYDLGSKNIIWLILWLVVMAAFLTSILYHFDYKKDVEDRGLQLQSVYKPSSESELAVIKEVHKNALPKLNKYLNTHPHIGAINKNDLTESVFEPIDYFDIVVSTNQDTSIYSVLQESPENTSKHTRRIGEWVFDPYLASYAKYDSILLGRQWIIHKTVYKKQIVNPELTIDYTIIAQGECIDNGLNLNNEEIMHFLSCEDETLVYDNSLYILHRPFDDVVLIAKKPIFTILKPITLFSFFFCLLTFLTIGFAFYNSIRPFLPASIPLRFSASAGLSTRIQVIIMSMVIFSFVAIAFVTSIYLQNQIGRGSEQELSRRINNLSKNVEWHLKEIKDNQSTPYILDNIRPELESIHNLDISLFDVSGTNVDINNDPEMIPYLAYHYFNHLNQRNAFTVRDKDEVMSYIPFVSEDKQKSAYIGLRYNDANESKIGVIDYLGTLLNVYVFLFLIAGAVALAIAKSITVPLETLAQRMTQIKLTRRNTPIEWQADDEIGTVIKNYNAMIGELEDSAKLIARTERDGAWKEMARNVAHEIKNPLTPMKLSIQYLERAVQQNPDNAIPLVKRISNTLVEQIDNLANIATAFSNFGKMPQADNEKVILNEVVETIHDLFRKRDDMSIRLSEPIEDLVVFADKNHLISILNNLVKNAIQAIPDDRKGLISIDLYRQDNDAIIKVSDNGVGIGEDKKDKIFTPNFTTKTSGSGLGLAISANMIEAFNGKLYFESEENVGSQFYVAIPLMKQFSDEQHNTILLD